MTTFQSVCCLLATLVYNHFVIEILEKKKLLDDKVYIPLVGEFCNIQVCISPFQMVPFVSSFFQFQTGHIYPYLWPHVPSFT